MALKNLLGSEKAVVVLLLIIGATVLVALGRMTVDAWQEYTTWLAGIYVVGKTAQGGIDAMANAKVEAAKASTPHGSSSSSTTTVEVSTSTPPS